eukprot:1191474-Prorocentrum_minimum.AAC.1
MVPIRARARGVLCLCTPGVTGLAHPLVPVREGNRNRSRVWGGMLDMIKSVGGDVGYEMTHRGQGRRVVAW